MTLTLVFVFLKSGTDPKTNMQIDLGMNNQQYGIVSGTVFTLVNSVFSLFMGVLADKYSRKVPLFCFSVMWTLMTALSFFCHTFGQILVPRILFAFFMSSVFPFAASLITAIFPHEVRGQANSIYVFGVYLGYGFGSLSLALDNKIG